MNRAEPACPAQGPQTGVWLHSVQHWASESWKHSRYTMVIAVLTTVIFAFPALTVSLQLDFDSLVGGQCWRILSGHLTHYDGQHLFWDLLMFVVLGAICEHQMRKSFGVFLVIMGTTVSLTVMFACSNISEYRGLSGIDTGLFAWLTLTQLRTCIAGRDRYFAAFWATSVFLLIGKLVFEVITGDVLFVQADGFKPILESHLAGAATGALAAVAAPTRGNDS